MFVKCCACLRTRTLSTALGAHLHVVLNLFVVSDPTPALCSVLHTSLAMLLIHTGLGGRSKGSAGRARHRLAVGRHDDPADGAHAGAPLQPDVTGLAPVITP